MIALTLASLTNIGVSGEQLDLLTRFGRQLAADTGDGSATGGSGGGPGRPRAVGGPGPAGAAKRLRRPSESSEALDGGRRPA